MAGCRPAARTDGVPIVAKFATLLNLSHRESSLDRQQHFATSKLSLGPRYSRPRRFLRYGFRGGGACGASPSWAIIDI